MADGGDRLTRPRDRAAEGRDRAAAWDACAGSDNPFVATPSSKRWRRAARPRRSTGWLPQHLLIEDDDRAAPRRRADVSEKPFLGRICVRSWLGRGARTRGRTATTRSSRCACPFTPGDRAAPAAPSRRRGPRRPISWSAAMVEVARRHKVSSLHVTFPTERGMAAAGRGRLPAARRPAVPLGERRAIATSTISSPRSPRASASRSSASAATRWPAGIEIETLTGGAIETRHWDAFFRLLHLDIRPQMGLGLSDARVLRPSGRAHGRPGGAGDGAPGQALCRGRAQPHRRARRSSGATGAAAATSRSCISRRAITAPSTSPSPAA